MAFVRCPGEKHSWTRKNRSGTRTWRLACFPQVVKPSCSYWDKEESLVIFKGRESRLFLPGQRPHGPLVNQKEKPPDQDGFCEVPRRKTLLDSQKSLGRDILERITPGLAKIARGLELGDLRVFRKS